MNPPPTSSESSASEALLEHSAALARLARCLVADAAGAEDLVQSTLLRALERAPAPAAGLGAWLARVLRNAAREEHRRGARRAGREREVAREEARPSSDELVERFDSRLAVTRAVRALDEPYREAILLRFFEDLPPRRIAARLGVPVKTVDSRLQRGLERLRQRLDREHGGDRAAWCAALLPLARRSWKVSLSTGVLVMNAKLLGTLAICLLGVALFFVWRAPAAAVEPVSGLAAERGPLAASPERAGLAAVPPAARTELARDESASRASDEPASLELEGRAYEVSGRPVSDLQLGWRAEYGPDREDRSGSVTTDFAGLFRTPVEPGLERLTVSCADARFVGVHDYDYQHYSGEPPQPLVIVAPRARVAGVVVDSEGAPIEGAELELELPEGYRAQLPFDLRTTRKRTWYAASVADGSFAFEDGPRVGGVTCRARKAGYEDASVAVDELASETLELVLARPATLTLLEGVVLDAAGAPLAGARVALGLLPATADGEGRFRFEFEPSAPPERLMAVAPGLLPETIERGTGAWPAFVEVRLARAPLALRGVVLDERGEPHPNAIVWLDEPTTFASWSGGFWVAENVISGRSGLQHYVATDADGRFELAGLVEREYGLLAMDSKRAWQIDAGRYPAGSDEVVIRFPADGLHARLEGRLIDSLGQPVSGAVVTVETLMLAARDPSGQLFYNGASGSSATTDERGAFVLEDVPRAGASLGLSGADLAFGQEHPIPNSADEPLVITVARHCELRVDQPAGALEASSFALLDAAGEVVETIRRDVGRIDGLQRAPLADGRSEVLSAPDTAVALVLYDAAGVELRRIDVRLRPGERNEIR